MTRTAAPRLRGRTFACLAATIGLGLLSRRFPLPGFLAEHTGDALYTVAVFCAFAVAAPAAPGRRLAALAFLASAAVECLQLVSLPWLDALRATRAGALVLGQGFQWEDLLAYAVGGAAAFSIDRLFLALASGDRSTR